MEHYNRIDLELGLKPKTPINIFYANPTAYNFRRIPVAQQTPELIEYACLKDWTCLRYVSKHFFDKDLYIKIIGEHGAALEYLPQRYMTGDIILTAICNDAYALKYVPEEMKTMSLCLMAVRQKVIEWYDEYPLAYVPKKFRTQSLLFLAIENNPLSIGNIEKDELTPEIVKKAFALDKRVIAMIPKSFITREMTELALNEQAKYLVFVPAKYINRDMALKAVSKNWELIGAVPERLVDDELINVAIDQDPKAVQYIVQSAISKERWSEVFRRDAGTIFWIPARYRTNDMYQKVITDIRFCLKSKEDLKKRLSYKNYIQGLSDTETYYSENYEEEAILFSEFPKSVQSETTIIDYVVGNTDYSWKDLLRYSKETVSVLTNSAKKYIQSNYEKEEAEYKARIEERNAINNENHSNDLLVKREDLYGKIYDTIEEKCELDIGNSYNIFELAIDDSSKEIIRHENGDDEHTLTYIYYISDIHILHQAKEIKNGASGIDFVKTFSAWLDQKVFDMISYAEKIDGLLLIGGDVAENPELSKVFYKKLKKYWKGTIVSVLGNHELWDMEYPDKFKGLTLEEVFEEYRKHIEFESFTYDYSSIQRGFLLENEVFVCKGTDEVKLNEQLIMSATDEELADFLKECTIVVLGGVGYAGRNKRFNAENGEIYRETIRSVEIEERLTARFMAVYEKIEKCASDKKVIVLTHMPVSDWVNKELQPGWIYVNGHTHHNSYCIENHAYVYSDNQVGYAPIPWKLNGISLEDYKDPFASFPDGIHDITSEQYRDFYLNKGIKCDGCKWEGKLMVMKQKDTYMFVLKSKNSLCIMNGGQRRRLDLDIQYYYDHMLQYIQAVKLVFKPYISFLNQVSLEVKAFGGSGRIHGCIVDIDFWSHIYVNPFDGTMTAYNAKDITGRDSYRSVEALVNKHCNDLIIKYKMAKDRNLIPLLDKYMGKRPRIASEIMVPEEMAGEWVEGTDMYKPSNIIRRLQYIWNNNIIREWDDELLRNARNISQDEDLLLNTSGISTSLIGMKRL